MRQAAGWAVVALVSFAVIATVALAKPKSEEDKTLYAMGVMLSKNLSGLALDAKELGFLLEGMEDGVLGRDPKVELADYSSKIQSLAKERQVAAAEAERAASAVFLEAAAKEQGAERTDSGLVVQIESAGAGPKPAVTDTVKVHYHGTLRDGTVFDSSVDRGEPARFPLNRVIPCWTEALQTLPVGTKAKLTCPAEIAYGDRGAPPHIKPGAVLTFQVELLEIE